MQPAAVQSFGASERFTKCGQNLAASSLHRGHSKGGLSKWRVRARACACVRVRARACVRVRARARAACARRTTPATEPLTTRNWAIG
eukprot:3531858-Pleurochrysis_carterae.AAC.2